MLKEVRHELLMLHSVWPGFKFKSNKNMTTKRMAYRGEHRSAIGVVDDFRSVTITPYLSPRRYFTHRAGSDKFR